MTPDPTAPLILSTRVIPAQHGDGAIAAIRWLTWQGCLPILHEWHFPVVDGELHAAAPYCDPDMPLHVLAYLAWWVERVAVRR